MNHIYSHEEEDHWFLYGESGKWCTSLWTTHKSQMFHSGLWSPFRWCCMQGKRRIFLQHFFLQHGVVAYAVAFWASNNVLQMELLKQWMHHNIRTVLYNTKINMNKSKLHLIQMPTPISIDVKPIYLQMVNQILLATTAQTLDCSFL